MSQADAEPLSQHPAPAALPLGAHIIRAVRAYDSYVTEMKWGLGGVEPEIAISELRHDTEAEIPGNVIDALERVVVRETRRQPEQLVAAH